MLRSFAFILLYAALVCTAAMALDAHADSARRELQLRQQQDALNLNLQQSMRARRYDLSPTDAQRLDQLDLQQRLQQQQLDQQQLELSRRDAASLPPGAGDAHLRAQRDAYTQERQLQLQQFELDRQRLLQSAPRDPLQTPAGGQLRLP
ncbi:MAG: hypothetical protein JWO70_3205 [Betaproteobacteria bacterium]|nr:hypothetical protein [Betaproteobacteria bacterium]